MLVRHAAQHLKELRPKVVLAALTLDRLDEDRRDAMRVSLEGGLDLGRSAPLGGLHGRDVQRELDLRARDAGPVELWKVAGLQRVGVGDGERVAASAVESVDEVEDLVTTPLHTPGPVLLHLPIERRLHRVLHRQRAARDEEQIAELIRYRDLAKDLDERGVLA